jgi:hypothetical protein
VPCLTFEAGLLGRPFSLTALGLECADDCFEQGYNATMPSNPITIFLSGTRRDLREFYPPAQVALKAAFPEFEVRMMEDAEPEDIPGDHWSRREATRPDVLVGLIGKYYGTTLTGQDRSLTEQEFDVAGQIGIERLMLLTEAGTAVVLEGQNDTDRERIAAFRTKIDGCVVRRGINTPAEFASHAVEAVREWERKTLRGATQRADDYFAPLLSAAALFSHTEPLVAQQEALNQLLQFSGSSKRVMVLHAPWGRGKSRVLLEFARQATTPARFIRADAPLSRSHLEISSADATVLVLEDPHRRTPDELRSLLAFLHRCDPSVKLIVASRTTAVDEFEAAARAEGIAMSELETRELSPLSDADQRRLVVQVLGVENEFTQVLAVRTRGSSLAALLAARLIQRRQVTFADLDQSHDFAAEVLGRFKDALLTAPGIDPSIRERLQSLLHAVALCAPIRPGDPDQRDALAAFLHRQREELSQDLATLEDLGLLLRRGGLVTIPVEAIREAEALGACLTRRGESTGLAERALRELSGLFRGSLLRTLAQVEWRVEQTGQQVSLLDRVWPELEAIYDGIPASLRLPLLKDLAGVAPFQPQRAIVFVRHAVGSGLGPPETEELWRRAGPLPIARIHDALTAIIREILYEPSCIGEACGLLHQMSQGDYRTAPQHPECAKRVLLDLAKLSPHQPLSCYDALLDWIDARQHDGSIPGEQLAELLRPLLSKEVEHGYSDERAMHFWSEAVSLERVEPIHYRAHQVLRRLADAPDTATMAAGIAAMSDALDPPSGIWHREVGASELARWESEQLGVIAQLTEIAEARQCRVADICVMRAVHSAATFSEQPALKTAANQVFEQLLGRLKNSLELTMVPYWEPPWGPNEGGERAQQQGIESTAGVVVASGGTPAEIAGRVLYAYDEMRAAGFQPEPRGVLAALTRLDNEIGASFVRACLDGPEHEAGESAFTVLDAVLEQDVERGRALIDEIIASERVSLMRALARGFFSESFRTKVGERRTLTHWQVLLESEDIITRIETLRAIWMAKEISPSLRIPLLVAYDPERDKKNALDMWSLGLDDLFPHLESAQMDELLMKLRAVPEIDYHVEGVLLKLAPLRPAEVIDLLLARVSRIPDASEDFEAIPFRIQRDCLAPIPAIEKEQGLYQLGSLLHADDFGVQHAAQDLFAKLGGNDLQVKRRVRASWTASADPNLILCASKSFRQERPQSLFDEEESVTAILRAANDVSSDLLQLAQSELAAASANGVRTGTPGEPMPEDVSIRDRARATAASYAEGSIEARFYENVARQTQASIDALQRTHEEEAIR